MAPPNGALNATPRPAPASADRIVRPSWAFSRVRRASSPPTASPICTVGPSLPSAMPTPSARVPPTNFAGITRQDDGWPSWRTIASTRCTPLPAASGLHRTVSRARPTATAAASTGRASRHPPRSRAHTSSASQEAPASASASRNSPPSRPVTMAPSPVRRANLSRPGWALSSGGGRSGTVGTHGSVLTRWSANRRTNPVRVTHMSVTRPGRPQDGAAHGSDWPPL